MKEKKKKDERKRRIGAGRKAEKRVKGVTW